MARAEVIEDGEPLNPEEKETLHPVPTILIDESSTEPQVSHHPNECTAIWIYKAQRGAGYAYLRRVQPDDIKTPDDLLMLCGPGLYKLVGRCDAGSVVKVRGSFGVGDYENLPAMSMSAPQSSPAPMTNANAIGGLGAFVTALTAAVSPIVTAIMESSARRDAERRQDDERRDDQRRRDEDRRRADQDKQHETMLQLISKLDGARIQDLENIIRGQQDGGGGGMGAKMPSWFVQMLDLQRATYTDLLDTAKDVAGNSATEAEFLKTVQAAITAFREANKDPSTAAAAAANSNGAPSVASTPTE